MVTGAGGFVGRNIVRELVGQGISVLGTYRRGLPRELERLAARKGCELVCTDLVDAPRLPDGVEAIIHTAAQATASGKPVADYVRNNVRATQNVADYAVRSGVKRIVNLSSLSVYGQIRSQVVDESTEILNPSPYGASKHLGELVLEEIGSVVPSVSLRLPGISSFLHRPPRPEWRRGR